MSGRLRQVLYYLTPEPESASQAFAEAYLQPRQLEVFRAMGRADQAHAVRVARRLVAEEAPRHVIEAALLHDCGKPRGYGLFWRSAGVLAAPLLAGLPKEPPMTGMSRWLQVYRWHDAYGLDLAREAGTSPEAMALLEAYAGGQTREAPAWLEPLKRSDDAG